MHFGNGRLTRCRDVLESEFRYCSDLNTTRFLEKMIQLENPDFVAFTGNELMFLALDIPFVLVLYPIQIHG